MTNTMKLKDLSLIIWFLFPLGTFVFLVVLAAMNPDYFALIMDKDNTQGTAYVELATVLFLVPGIMAGLVAFFCHRKKLPTTFLMAWIFLWSLAALFFGGEEISWGQWIFHWDTPEALQQWNDQGETNLHNMGPIFGPLFDQIPRAIVESWIIFAGFYFALWKVITKKRFLDPHDWKYWVFPTFACIPAAGMVGFMWTSSYIYKLPWLERHGFSGSELGEFYVAIFLMVYLLSFWYRLRQVK